MKSTYFFLLRSPEHIKVVIESTIDKIGGLELFDMLISLNFLVGKRRFHVLVRFHVIVIRKND